MDIGQIMPIEEPHVEEGEEQCSTQVEPSPTQDPQTSQEHAQVPHVGDQVDQGQDQTQDVGDSSPNDAQDLDPQDDQASIEPQDNSQEALDCYAMRVASRLQQQEHTLDNVLGA